MSSWTARIAVAFVLLALGAGVIAWWLAVRAPVDVDTRGMLGLAPRTSEQRGRATHALDLLERDVDGPLQCYRALLAANTLRARGDLGGPSVRGTIKPFAAEITALESELWTRLARDLDEERIRALRTDGFERDAFPFGRAPHDFVLTGASTADASAFELTGPSGKHATHGALRFDTTLAHAIDGR